jgi:hypothetical protein
VAPERSLSRASFGLDPVVEEELMREEVLFFANAHPEEEEEEEEEEVEEEAHYTEDDGEFAANVERYRGNVLQLFKLIEQDGDGELSIRELRRAAQRILKAPISAEEAQIMFDTADWDGGGTITATEFGMYLGMPSGGKRTKLSDVAEQRVLLVSACFNRLAAEPERARELLLLLQSDVERDEAQRRLGLTALNFSLHNPTGFYNLNLSFPADREVAIRHIFSKVFQREFVL